MATSSCCLSIDDFNHVAIACQNFAPEWEKLAMYLNIDRVIVLTIQKEGAGGQTTGWCLNRLITVWLQQSSPTQPKPSWRLMCDAVSNIDRPLSEKIWTDHTSGCSLCRATPSSVAVRSVAEHTAGCNSVKSCHSTQSYRNSPVAIAVNQNDPQAAATELKNIFDELLKFMIKEICHVDIMELRLGISRHFQDKEEKVDDTIDQYLAKLYHYTTPHEILDCLIRYNFIGYINYSLIKVFQGLAKSPLLDKRIEEYEREYHSFLGLTFMEYTDAFQRPDLRPEYPAGIPKFSFKLESKWNGENMFTLKEILKLCFDNNADCICIHQLMIASIKRHCIIITFAVLPHIAKKMLGYLTNDDVIKSMKKEGISVDISKQLMKYEELETTDSMQQDEQISDRTLTLGRLETDPPLHSIQSKVATGILSAKPNWDNDTGYGTSVGGYSEGDSETTKNSRLVELKEDVTLKEAVDTYEYVLTMKQNQIKSFENQLVTHKQMMMELDNTRGSLKLERDNYTKEIQNYQEANLRSEKEITELKKNLERVEGERDVRVQAIASMREELARTKKHHQEFLVKFKHLTEGELLELTKMLIAEAKKGDVNEVSKLVLLGADIHYTNQNMQTPLHVASKAGHTDVVFVLLCHGAYVDVIDNEGLTSLHLASKYGYSEILDRLLSYGANVDMKENNYFQTPLHFAAIGGYIRIVQTLLINGASPSIKADRKQTPLHRASENGHVEIVKLLIEFKAAVNVKNQFGNTPLHLASAKGSTEIVQLLVESGQAKFDVQNGESKSPLHEACLRGRQDVVQLLLSYNASITVKDWHDQSPIHAALLQCHTNIAMLLVSAGADITLKDKYGQTPILIAVVLKLEDVLKFFQSTSGVTNEDLKKYELPPTWKASLDDEEPERIIYTNHFRDKQQYEHPKTIY